VISRPAASETNCAHAISLGDEHLLSASATPPRRRVARPDSRCGARIRAVHRLQLAVNMLRTAYFQPQV